MVSFRVKGSGIKLKLKQTDQILFWRHQSKPYEMTKLIPILNIYSKWWVVYMWPTKERNSSIVFASSLNLLLCCASSRTSSTLSCEFKFLTKFSGTCMGMFLCILVLYHYKGHYRWFMMIHDTLIHQTGINALKSQPYIVKTSEHDAKHCKTWPGRMLVLGLLQITVFSFSQCVLMLQSNPCLQNRVLLVAALYA